MTTPRASTSDPLSHTSAAILAGGLGTRLRSVVPDKPKILAEVGGRPFVLYLLDQLVEAGVSSIVLCTGHLAEQVEGCLGPSYRSATISYSVETEPLGTGGALRLALGRIESQIVLVMNGDSYCGVDLLEMARFHAEHGAVGTIAAAQVPDTSRYGSVRVAEGHQIIGFAEKSQSEGPGRVNAGIYMLSRHVLEEMPGGMAVSLEREVFPRMVGGRLLAYETCSELWDIGVPEAFARARNEFRSTLVREKVKSSVEAAQLVRSHLLGSCEVKQLTIESCTPAILKGAQLLIECFQSGGKLLLCGNGGSAADCQHMAAELVSRMTRTLVRPGLPVLALTTDTSFLTAYANDYDYADVFVRQVEAFGRPGDVLLGISTSGNSENVVRAVDAAHRAGMRVITLTGESGRLTQMGEVSITIPSSNTQYIQEAHLGVEHLLCFFVEHGLFDKTQQLQFSGFD